MQWGFEKMEDLLIELKKKMLKRKKWEMKNLGKIYAGRKKNWGESLSYRVFFFFFDKAIMILILIIIIKLK